MRACSVASIKRRLPPDQQLKADLSVVLATPEGRRYLFELVERCQVAKDIWIGTAEIHRRAGMQAVGLSIMADIQSVRPDLTRLPLAADTVIEVDDNTEESDDRE